MDSRSREIASSNNPFGILDLRSVLYGRKLLILIRGKNLSIFIRGNKNTATGTGDTEALPVEDSRVLKTITMTDKINKAGIDIGTSGVGINRQINPEVDYLEKFLQISLYQGQFNYGGAVNFKIPF